MCTLEYEVSTASEAMGVYLVHVEKVIIAGAPGTSGCPNSTLEEGRSKVMPIANPAAGLAIGITFTLP